MDCSPREQDPDFCSRSEQSTSPEAELRTDGESLHGLGDFYTSMLQALPDASREALGYEIGQGIRLKEALQKAPIKQEAFRAVLADHPVSNPDPVVVGLRGGMQGYELMEVVEEA